MFQISSKGGQKGRSVFQKVGRNTSLLFFCNFILVTHAVPDNCDIYCDARPVERHYIHYIFNMHSQKPFKKMRVNLQAKSLYFTTLSNTYKDKLVLSSSTVSRLLFDFKISFIVYNTVIAADGSKRWCGVLIKTQIICSYRDFLMRTSSYHTYTVLLYILGSRASE